MKQHFPQPQYASNKRIPESDDQFGQAYMTPISSNDIRGSSRSRLPPTATSKDSPSHKKASKRNKLYPKSDINHTEAEGPELF